MPPVLPLESQNLADLDKMGAILNADQVFCMIPWVHLHVMPNSAVIPCCVWPYQDKFGDGKTQDVGSIWNSEKYRELRKNMLAGKASAGCEHCYALDKAGFGSMRQSNNNRFAHLASTLALTNSDGSHPDLKLKYIDIRFSNLCNFRCRGCGPDLSSAWYEDHQQLYNYKSDKARVSSIATDSPTFWEELKTMIPDAEEIYFGGGEPLITREHFEVLKLLIAQNKTDVRLSYNTNLSTLAYGNQDLARMWSHFKEVVIGISLDDIGPRAEYFRKGTDWNTIVANMRRLVEDFPGIRRYINCTVSVHNVYYLPEIIEWLTFTGLMGPNEFNVNMLLDPIEYVIQTLPLDLKEKTTRKFNAYVDKNNNREDWQKLTATVRNVIKFMNEKDSSEQNAQFRERTSALDRIRGESFIETFPELKRMLEDT